MHAVVTRSEISYSLLSANTMDKYGYIRQILHRANGTGSQTRASASRFLIAVGLLSSAGFTISAVYMVTLVKVINEICVNQTRFKRILILHLCAKHKNILLFNFS